MRIVRGPTCIDEAGGADGRETGRERKLQARLDEMSAWKREESEGNTKPQPHAAPVEDASSEAWARAEAICVRNGLGPSPAARSVSQTAAAPNQAVAANHTGGRTPSPAEVSQAESGPIGRSCRRCSRPMNRLATLCGYCWLKVAPMAHDGVEPPALPVHRPWWKF